MIREITPLVLTYDEEPNIVRTLNQLKWASRIVVLDSFSRDATVARASAIPGVEVVQRKFDQHSSQWNFGVAQCRTEWILALDADHVLSDELVREIEALGSPGDISAYFARFRYCVFGKRLRATLYPPRVVLFRKSACVFEQDGHTQALKTTGAVGWLKGEILHDDRKPLSRWLADQERYAGLEAVKLFSTPLRQLRVQDRLRQMVVPAPFLVFAYSLFVKGLLLDGFPGFCYVLQRTIAEFILSLKLLEHRLRN
jgi:glycosyltransferase involved in cell wall biosynthesis